MKSRKAPEVDNIMVEEMGAVTIGSGAETLLRLFRDIGTQSDSSGMEVLNHNSHTQQEGQAELLNYRGISLLCHSSKIFSSIILQRIKGRTEEILAEAQCRFRANRSTIDQIFTLRQLAEKYEEFGKDLYVCYIDFRKAFDSIWRKGFGKQ